jgi:hypothetical protein
MFSSTTQWIRKAGKPGVLMIVDISNYPIQNPADDAGLRYTKGAALDLYESLRQFIDATDDLAGCLIVFMAHCDFD